MRVDLARVSVLPAFKWLATTGGIAESEMLRTFNCGVGMIAVVESAKADTIAALLAQAGESVARLGEVVAESGKPRVIYDGHLALT